MAGIVTLQHAAGRLQAAVDAFVSQPDLAPSSRRSYAQTMHHLSSALGADHDLSAISPTAVEHIAQQAWGAVGPATWNRHLAALRSFVRYCQRRGWPLVDLAVGLERRREKTDRTRVITYPELERLWSRDSISLREKCLWRLMYETACRAEEALGLNVEDLDLPNKRAVVISKGGDRELVYFQSGAARLLPRLIARRTRGPLFRSSRQPTPARTPATADRCPETGLARLSYRRAAELFTAATGGRTLHDLRRASLSHLSDANVSLPLLMAKSRHTHLRSLQRYLRPSPDAVAALTAAHDPARRRR